MRWSISAGERKRGTEEEPRRGGGETASRPGGQVFQAMVSVMAVKIQLSSPRGVCLFVRKPGNRSTSAGVRLVKRESWQNLEASRGKWKVGGPKMGRKRCNEHHRGAQARINCAGLSRRQRRCHIPLKPMHACSWR